jgi:hypothetical protein
MRLLPISCPIALVVGSGPLIRAETSKNGAVSAESAAMQSAIEKAAAYAQQSLLEAEVTAQGGESAGKGVVKCAGQGSRKAGRVEVNIS